MKKIVWIGLALSQIGTCPGAHGATSMQAYELQERCGKQAENWFRSEWGHAGVTNTKKGQATANYRNHFNGAMSKCFVLLTYLDLPYKDKKQSPSTQITLFDVNENKEYGTFFKFANSELLFQCDVEKRHCKSRDEWETMIAPYMGD